MSSRAVGGSSSSWRFGNLFSFILSVALLFAASGAWAADWTDANGNEYTALKYIKGNGSGTKGGPYIITDFKPVANSTVKLRFKPTTVSENECLFCSRKKASNKVSNSMSGFRIGTKIRLDRYHTARYVTCNTTSLAADNDYSLLADFSGKNGKVTKGIATINGIDQELSDALGNTAYTPASKLTLFASHEDADVSASSTFSSKGSFYLYYFQLYSPDDGSLTHNLMPAQNSSGVAGLYDTVTQTFYGPTGPDGYTAFTTEAYAVRTGKKWTGLGADNKMSTAANWQGGSAPVEGEALDFTIAVPNASIVADIEDVTFGKIYLGTGDLPAFSGALSATGINDLERMTAYDTATDGFAFTLAAPSGQDFTWNGGAAADWNTTDASWLYNNAASVWYDYNNAIFSTENATATLTENAIAASLSFTQPATIVGSAVLTVPAVSVAPNVSATISAPTAGALEKTGEGTLTLGSSRTDQTTVSEGTLAMSGSGTTLDWSKLTLGTDPEKPVTVRFEAGAAPTSGDWYLGSGNITSTVVKASGDWARGDKDIHIGSGVGADTTFIHEGGSLTCSRFIRVGTSGAANSTLILSGGVITNSNTQTGSGREPRTAIGYTSDGTLIVTNGASLAVTGQYLGISDANRMKGIVEIYDGSTVDVAYAVIFGQVSQQGWGEGKLNLHTGGTLATQVIRCSTNYATPADATAEVNFDGGILKAKSSTRLIQKHDHLTVNVSAKGGTINNNGMNIIIEESFNGPGTINLTGSGTTSFAAGVGAEGGVSVANGTTLVLDVTEQSSLGSLTLAAGSKLALSGVTQSSLGTVTLESGSTIDIATPASDVAAFAATKLILPAEGKVTLTKSGGAFGEGVYAICRNGDVTVAEAEERFDFDITDMRVASWSKVDDLLVLTVKVIERTWIAEAGESFSWSEGWGENGWSDGVDAIFETAGAIASVDDDVAANSVKFKENAAINGESTLTPNIVYVAEGKEATINAPTAGELTKTGAGTLTLGSSRTDQTTLSEGTLAMASGATLDITKFTLGTDPAKPVSLDLGGAGLSADLTARMSATVGGAAGGSVAIDNGAITNTATLRVGNGSLTLGSGADVTMNASAERWVCVGGINSANEGLDIIDASLVLDGASIRESVSSQKTLLGIGDFGSYPSKGTMIVKNGGSFTTDNSAYVAQGCEGHLVIDGEGSSVTAYQLVFCGEARCADNENGYVVVTNGGTLVVDRLGYGSGKGEGYFRFDGGTLRAKTTNETLLPAHEKLHYEVGELGGTIDNDAKNITIAKSFSGPGMIDLTGSGKTTFAAGVGVDAEGGVYVDTGTTLTINGATPSCLGMLILEKGSTLDIATPASDVAAFEATELLIPEKGAVTLTSGGGAFVEGLYAICKMSGVTAEAGAKFAPVTGDLVASWSVVDNTLMLTVGAVDGNTWTGRAGDSNLSNPENWLGRAVPESGTVTINTTGTLTVGDKFRPDVIVFPETCGAVTIAGENAITGIMAITNLSSSICTFEVPVEFADKILVIQNAVDWSTRDQSSVRFAGGVTGTDFAEGTARYLNGVYTLTAAEDWIANTQGNKDRWGIPEGSSLTLPFSSDTSEIALGEHKAETGGAFTAAVVRTSARVSCWNRGEYVVTEELAVTLPNADRHISYRGGEGAYKLEKLTLGDKGKSKWFYFANSGDYYGDKNIWIGAGGLNFLEGTSVSTAYACGRRNSDVIRVYPWYSDYAIGTKAGSTGDIQIQKKTHFGTTDENGVARTVTCNGIMGGSAAVSIEGAGRFVVNNVNTASSAVTVTDTATLAINAGKQMTSGAMTVNSGATLEVASGVNTFGGLTLNDGATLAFNFTERAVTPQIAVAGDTTLTVIGAVNVKIPADSKWPTSGEKVLTTCGGFTADKVSLVDGAPNWVRGLSVNDDGNIVLDVKPMGTKVIVR